MARKGLIAWAGLGLLGLLFQATLFFKDDWAAYHPQWRPVLDVFCKWSGCLIAPLQRFDAVLIDHASIDLISAEDASTDRVTIGEAAFVSGPQWRFQITLRNSQNIEVAMPWLELTLTDSQDEVLTRQVFNPSVWGAPAVLRAGEIWSQDLTLRLGRDQTKFVAYRLLTFYP